MRRTGGHAEAGTLKKQFKTFIFLKESAEAGKTKIAEIRALYAEKAGNWILCTEKKNDAT